jgi:hypothetical protein
MKNEANEFDIPISETMKMDILATVEDLMDLAKRGTIKSYMVRADRTAESVLSDIRRQVMDLTDEDEELEEELRGL